jgi:hydrogenase maturation protease
MPVDRPARVLVAGVGNIFLGDDAFGVEVVRRLAKMQLPEQVRLVDVGVRTVHLAYELSERRYDAVILVDAISNGADPGTVHVFEPETDATSCGEVITDPHATHAHEIFALVRRLGGELPSVLIVACEPCRIGPDAGLSPVVAAAVDDAVQVVLRLIPSAAVAPIAARN